MVAILYICVVFSLTTTTINGIKWTVPPKNVQSTPTSPNNNWEEEQKSTSDDTTSNSNIVTFDLSGNVDCLLLSTFDDDNDSGQIPLFNSFSKTKKKMNRFIPSSIHIGTNYDFQQVWFGATRFISKFRWNNGQTLELSKGLLPNINDSFSTQLTMDLPIPTETEKTIPSSSSLSPSVQLKWNLPTTNDDDDETSQQSSTPLLSALVRFPILKRLNIEYKSIFCLKQHDINNDDDYMETRVPYDGSNWVPDLRLSGTGQLNCISQGRIPQSIWKNNPSIGVRFSIRKQLDWNAFGFIHPNNHNNDDDASLFGRTWFQCELMDTKDTSTFHSLTISTILEEIQKSTQLTIRREQIFAI